MHWFERFSEIKLLHIGMHSVVELFPRYFNPVLSKSYVIIDEMMSGYSF